MSKLIHKVIKAWSVLLLASLALVGCGQEKSEEIPANEINSDLEYVKDKEKFVVGVTEFKPLDYRRNNKWVGFDAELAEWFAKELDVPIEFKEIAWNQKEKLLKDKSIDCIWNGMSYSERLKDEFSCSIPYLKNGQAIVVASENTAQLQSEQDCMHLLFATESGSTGEQELKNRHYRFNSLKTQTEALESVSSGKTDAAVIDWLMAKALTGEGKEYANLTCIDTLNEEKCVVAFRQKSDLTESFNEFFVECYRSGSIEELADKYAVQTALIKPE